MAGGTLTATIGVERLGRLAADDLFARSRRLLDRPLAHDAELSLAELSDEAVVLGAFQRGAGMHAEYMLQRRASGGPSVRVGPGTLYMSLALKDPSSLVRCTPDKLVNRYVRPLLAALTRSGAPAHYFGRDWISVEHRPAAFVGFAHSSSGRSAVEAIVAVSHPFAMAQGTFREKDPGTLDEITGRTIDPTRLADAVAVAYAEAYARAPIFFSSGSSEASRSDPNEVARRDPPWAATAAEAIGEVAAGRDKDGVLRVGGDLMVTREAITNLEAALAKLPDDASEADVARAVSDALALPDTALFGVRALSSVVDVILRARRSA